jgi:ectoine hydroxylase-related dioxygenase (phytanoyl-CoA dioxygenase family)
MNRQIYQLRTAGYTFLRGALERQRVEDLGACIDRMLAEDDKTWGADALKAIGQRGALRNLCDYDIQFQRLLSDTPIYYFIDEVLGADYVLHSFDGLVLFPGDGRFPWDFHTDFSQLSGVSFPADRTFGINCLYYMDDATEMNGATWLVPASQHCILRAPAPSELAPLAIQAVGRAGDALLFDARLWHCAGRNISDHPRRLVKAMYCSPWLRPQMDYARAVRPEVRGRLDTRTLYLLGVGSAPPVSVKELREDLSRGRRQ